MPSFNARVPKREQRDLAAITSMSLKILAVNPQLLGVALKHTYADSLMLGILNKGSLLGLKGLRCIVY